MRHLAVAAAVLLVAGCATPPQQHPMRIETPSEWVGSSAAGRLVAPATSDVPPAAREWWRDLGDPLLDALVQEATADNLDLQRARARVLEARAARVASDARLQPSLDGGVRVGRRNTEPIGRERTSSLFEATFDAAWEIDLFGALANRADAARAHAEAVAFDADGVLLSLRAEIAREYVGLRDLQQRLLIARAAHEASADTAALVSSLRTAGLRTELDEVQARSVDLTLAARIPPLEAATTAALRRLETLLGRPPGSLDARLSDPGTVPLPTQAALLDTPAAVVARRPDLRRAERDLASSIALGNAAAADIYPRLSLAALFGVRDVSSAASLGIGSLTAGLVAPLFDAGRRRAEADAADARRLQALHTYRQAVLRALEDVETCLAAYAGADRQRQALDALVEAERIKLALAEARYRRGIAPFLEVLDAQRTLFDAQTAQAGARADVARGYVALAKALGG